MRAHTPLPTSGFTLIELSVVLIIIGLLLGAVVGGQALIKNAELQFIMTDAVKYRDAAVTFKKQYNAIPGDMADALDFWGQSTACGGTSATGTCNGNGDKVIDFTTAGNSAEAYQFWRQLALAGRITGQYTGITGSGAHKQSIPGTNVPAGRLVNSGWEVGSEAYMPDSTYFAVTYGNYMRVGKQNTTGPLNDKLLPPEDAWKIDTKMDDGMPGRGTIIASHPIGECTTATTNSGIGKPYKVADTSEQCTLFFVNQFNQ